jgi:hypothetical protein
MDKRLRFPMSDRVSLARNQSHFQINKGLDAFPSGERSPEL